MELDKNLGKDIPYPFRELPLPEIMMVLDAVYDSRIVAYAIQDTYDKEQMDRFITGHEQPTEQQE